MAGVSTASALQVAEPRLPLSLQVLYGVGEIPITVTMGLIGIYVLFFYNSVMRLDGALAGFGVTAGLIVDAVVDPYIGFLSDRSRLPLGRRQSFMLAGWPRHGAVLSGRCSARRSRLENGRSSCGCC